MIEEPSPAHETEVIPDYNILIEESDPELKKQLKRALRKFKAMDEDGNGVLNGDELVKLAEWVFDSFHPGG